MITKEMIISGIYAGVVKLIDGPHDSEHVCKIGEHWLYYAGHECFGLTSADYTANVPLDEIASEIVFAIESIRDDFDGADEYGYYEAVLRDAGITESKEMHIKEYNVELHYGYMYSHKSYETYHAFELTDPNTVFDYEAVTKKLAEQLDATTDDVDFNFDIMDVKIPDSVVRRIQNDLINEIISSCGGDKERSYYLLGLRQMLNRWYMRHYTLKGERLI